MDAPAPDEIARAAALDFARVLAPLYQAHLREQLIGMYAIGSLAHGGFSRRYSDIDVALITEQGLDAATLAELRAVAAERDPALGAKISLFWTDRRFAIGRFPPLDRIDYLDHPVVLTEHERVEPARPPFPEVRAYLKGMPFANWTANVQRFAATDALLPADRKTFIRTLLYPARLVYSWSTGRMASNDDAVAFTREHRPPGLDVEILARALACRQAAADPDALLPARSGLPGQVESCVRLLSAE